MRQVIPLRLRLSPLAFPRNPYHHLVKHYHDGGLKRGQVNDPELNARLALEVFGDQRQALREAAPDLLAAWHWLSTPKPEGKNRALDDFFSELRGSHRPSDTEALAVIGKRLSDIACATHGRQVMASFPPPLANCAGKAHSEIPAEMTHPSLQNTLRSAT